MAPGSHAATAGTFRRGDRELPDNYATAVKAKRYPAEFQADRKSAAFLPADLWDPKGPWVLLGDRQGGLLAGQHVQFFGGRSTFMIFFGLPEGRDQTLKYVDQLSEWLKKGAKGGPATVPQFSANTQFALVRRTMLLDDRGEIRPTPLTEQVQLQILHDPTKAPDRPTTAPDRKPGVQTFLEFRLRREQLLAGKAGGLGAVPDDEGEWQHLTFYGGGPLIDGFAVVLPIMASCRGCHSHGPGVCRSTVSSAASGTSRPPGTRSAGFRVETRARLLEVVGRNQEIDPEQMTRRKCRRRTRRCSRRPPPCWFLGVHSSLGRRPLLSLCVRHA